MSEIMEPSHTATMNLRFVERPIIDSDGVIVRKVKILQQMMMPKDWSKHEEYWRDVPCVDIDA